MLLFAPIFAPIRTECASDREWRSPTGSSMAVAGIQCASVYWMSNPYLANPWLFGRRLGNESISKRIARSDPEPTTSIDGRVGRQRGRSDCNVEAAPYLRYSWPVKPLGQVADQSFGKCNCTSMAS